MAHRDPLPRWGQPTPRHEAMHVGMQHQRLAPGVESGVECDEDARLGPERLRVRQ